MNVNGNGLPETILVEFLQPNGDPIHISDLGTAFMNAHGISATNALLPFRVKVDRKVSHAGNFFFDYAQNGVTLPSGLSTFVRVEGVIVPMGRTRPSKKGYPTREGESEITMGGIPYKTTVYITESGTPFYVKVVAHKLPDRSKAISKAQQAPRGGRIAV